MNIGKGIWEVAGKISCELGKSARVDGKMPKRFPMNSEDRAWKMERCWKDFRRTSKVGRGRSKVYDLYNYFTYISF